MLNLLVISLILVGIYISFFGYQSVQKYLKKATIITTLQEEESSIVPPSNIFKKDIVFKILFKIFVCRHNN